ncbi:MAG TPA: tRNA uracil 4-sulfurtransferase ThiI [Candidatus Binataceae bacterium]|nr:tRNA uracil 4-sulfurtransferase ThiI [Candidatus Binataceae bacterium]
MNRNREDRRTSAADSDRYLIGRYHEVALKGRNRWRFVDELKRNVVAAFADHQLGGLRGAGPRLMVRLPASLSDEVAKERAARIFGLQNFSIGHRVPLEISAIERAALAAAQALIRTSCGSELTFRILARRAEKRFPLDSVAIQRTLGATIVRELGLKVNLGHPDLVVAIEILPEGAYVSGGKLAGAGGLPVGTTGQGAVLLSGGIDSPVAAYRMMRRGMRLNFIHFHSYPLVSSASRDKARDLAAALTSYEAHSTLMLVPFAEIQRSIVARAPRFLRVVLYRRFMLRIAGALGVAMGAQALVTGESLGQVASQTLENMTVIEQAASIPVIRPLIGMDKNEIIVEARRLGTFETSILPDEDCCSLFVPSHPATRARLEEVTAAEGMLEIAQMVDDAVARSEAVHNLFPAAATHAAQSDASSPALRRHELQ